MRGRTLLIVFLFALSLTIIGQANAQSTKAWYEGGNLHKSTIEQWVMADYSNRLATAADFFVSISKKENPEILDVPSSKFFSNLRHHATELEKCITSIGKDQKASRGLLSAEAASLCYLTMYKGKK